MMCRLVAIAGIVACLAGEARADPLFSGATRAVLTLTGISGGDASSLIAALLTDDGVIPSTAGGGFVDPPSASATTTFSPISAAVGNAITLDSVIGGGVTGSSGNASSLVTSTGGLSIYNSGSADITLTFSFDYNYSVQASTMGPLEAANASAIVSLKAITNLGDNAEDLTFAPTVSAGNGTSETTQTAGYPSFLSRTFSIVLSQGELASISMQANTNGSAVITAVPEPASMVLIGLGLAAAPLAFRKRRRPALESQPPIA